MNKVEHLFFHSYFPCYIHESLFPYKKLRCIWNKRTPLLDYSLNAVFYKTAVKFRFCVKARKFEDAPQLFEVTYLLTSKHFFYNFYGILRISELYDGG